MPIRLPGSTWKKWALHVHAPESFFQHYPGEKEAARDAILSDLEHLPQDFKVIGIDDYVLPDGNPATPRRPVQRGSMKHAG